MHQTQRELLSSVQRGELQGRQAALALGVVLCSRASELRELAARQMGRLWRQAEVVVPLLIAALQTDHGNVRAAAAEALGRLGPAATNAVPALEANASLHNGEVGALARDALASIRARQPIPTH
jgi:HEAT repeat protein